MSDIADFDPTPGMAIELAKGITRLLAPNPSPMTYRGTNSYVLGSDQLMIIDPGPAIDAHLDALVKHIAKRPVTHILLTHSHLDHSPLAAPLARITDAPVCAFGPSDSGRSAVMADVADLGGGEGMDPDFAPDQTLHDGSVVQNQDLTLTAHHTPGHMGNHMCFDWAGQVFSGDHIMGWASSLVSPPDGDLTDYMASLAKVQHLQPHRLYPGHGPVISTPDGAIRDLIAHRQSREAQILNALTAPKTPAELTEEIYIQTPKSLQQAAQRNVLAHLIDLTTRRLVEPIGTLHPDSHFQRR